MAFQFSLAALLRFRKSLEQQQEIRLLEANQKVADLLRAMEQVDRALAGVAAHDAHELKSGVPAAELHFDLLRRGVLRQWQESLEKELAAARVHQMQQRQAFQQAWRQREVVDTLRREQAHTYEQEQARREQRRLDHLFLLRRDFVRREVRRRG